MPRHALSALAALSLGTVALAQQDTSARLRPITAPVREVSVRLDRATGVAVRAPLALGGGGKEPVFANTCASGYYLGLSSAASAGGSQAQAVVSQGRVPSTASPQTATCATGYADAYGITQLQIAYCTTTGAPVNHVATQWNNLGAACPNDFGTPPSGVITVLGMPRSPAAGVLACYLVTVDLGTPGFTLNGGAADTTAGRFGWAHQYPLTTGSDGPLIAGNPLIGGCAPCVGTIWERPAPTTNPGTGLGSAGSYWSETFGGAATGCFFLGGSPFAGFHLRLDANPPACACGPPRFCEALDGAHALCPCGATNPNGGCDIAQGPGVQLDLAAQAPAPNGATLVGSGYPPASTPAAVVIRGNNQEGTPVPFYDGLRCVGLQGFARLAATVASGGLSTHAFGHTTAAGTYFYQVWFRNTPVSFCVTTGPGMGAGNLSNGLALTW